MAAISQKDIFIYDYVSLLNPRLVQLFTLDPPTLTLSFFSFAKTQRLQAYGINIQT